MIHIQRHGDATSFLARAESWLLHAEAEHNLLLGIAHLLRRTWATQPQPIYLATVERAGTVVGCAFRTPPYKFGLTAMPEAAVAPLVADVAHVYEHIPAVLGPAPLARAFAEQWAAQAGVAFEPGMQQRIYQSRHVVPPERQPPGELRVVTADDAPLVHRWIAAFSAEAMAGSPPLRDAAQQIARGAYYLWWLDGEPRCLVGIAARTPNGARIGPVYSPPAERGRGFASAATAAVTQLQLDAGAQFCFLYTDLSNPTSNAIYSRIGYEPVVDVVDYDFR